MRYIVKTTGKKMRDLLKRKIMFSAEGGLFPLDWAGRDAAWSADSADGRAGGGFIRGRAAFDSELVSDDADSAAADLTPTSDLAMHLEATVIRASASVAASAGHLSLSAGS